MPRELDKTDVLSDQNVRVVEFTTTGRQEVVGVGALVDAGLLPRACAWTC
jgi:hypothetical protein